MRDIVFKGSSFNDYNDWSQKDKKIFKRITILIKEIRRNPFEGTGNPEPLKHQFQGCWSRRINREHRLVYMIKDESIEIVSCKYHY